jgi:ribose/xylose/arabinose/galactoside ABC-type transport system permease subunit
MQRFKLNSKYYSLVVTIALFFLLFGIGSILYNNFSSPQNFLNLFKNNCFIICIGVGMTFVLITGGIDLSVGSVIALVCMSSAALLEYMHFNPFVVMGLMIIMGALIGFVQGCLIQFFKMQPFIATLAGYFFARGMTAVINTDTISITDPVYLAISDTRIYIIGKASISPGVVIALTLLAVAIYILHYTKFGRAIYAIGGNEHSALLMGLPVTRTKIMVYTLSGICSAIAGIVFSFYIMSGYTLHGQGMEMDAIAAAVIGGTALTGGVGYVFGTLFGVLINGTIQTLIMFQGTLSSWWTRIAIAALLCMFIVIQSLLSKGNARKRKQQKVEMLGVQATSK